jgi:hypothetical protein
MTEIKTRKLEYLAPCELKPDPRNPRKHPRPQVRALARSIEQFGFNAPILVDKQHQVVAGHGRLEAAKLLKLEQVPVICLDDLSDAKAMFLSGGQHQPHRQAILIDQGVDLGTQSSTRTANGVILTSFFPPAACWWARMIELSINAIEWGDLAAKASKTCTQTPAFAQRLKRL